MGENTSGFWVDNWYEGLVWMFVSSNEAVPTFWMLLSCPAKMFTYWKLECEGSFRFDGIVFQDVSLPTSFTAIRKLTHHGMLFLPIGRTLRRGMFLIDEAKGASSYGASWPVWVGKASISSGCCCDLVYKIEFESDGNWNFICNKFPYDADKRSSRVVFDGKSVAERALGFGSGTGCDEGAFGLRNWSDLRTGGLELEPDRLHVNKQARSGN
ncbi:hypothetical protein Tco_0278088 [Tanacetum coccineum]